MAVKVLAGFQKKMNLFSKGSLLKILVQSKSLSLGQLGKFLS
jgi:hypothetical protein